MTEYAGDRIQIETCTRAPGLLTMSEVYYLAWRAYVDGRPVRLYRADHLLLRAVAVPAGQHTVELRYESRMLQVGSAISALTVLTLIGGATSSASVPWWSSVTDPTPRRTGRRIRNRRRSLLL